MLLTHTNSYKYLVWVSFVQYKNTFKDVNYMGNNSHIASQIGKGVNWRRVRRCSPFPRLSAPPPRPSCSRHDKQRSYCPNDILSPSAKANPTSPAATGTTSRGPIVHKIFCRPRPIHPNLPSCSRHDKQGSYCPEDILSPSANPARPPNLPSRDRHD